MLGISVALGLAGGLLYMLTWRARLATWAALIPLAAVARLAAPPAAVAAALVFGRLRLARAVHAADAAPGSGWVPWPPTSMAHARSPARTRAGG
jgi:hypothetical protein